MYQWLIKWSRDKSFCQKYLQSTSWLHSLSYIFVTNSIGLASVNLMQLAPNAGILCERSRQWWPLGSSRSLKVVFKTVVLIKSLYVTSCYRLIPSRTISELLWRIGSNYHFSQEVSVFNSLVWTEALLDYEIWHKSQNHHSILCCTTDIEPFRCDGRTDRQKRDSTEQHVLI